jgi:hypothetical protein
MSEYRRCNGDRSCAYTVYIKYKGSFYAVFSPKKTAGRFVMLRNGNDSVVVSQPKATEVICGEQCTSSLRVVCLLVDGSSQD